MVAFLFIIQTFQAKAQHAGTDSIKLKTSAPNYKQIDIKDVIAKLKKHKNLKDSFSTTPKKFQLAVVPAIGYTQQTGFAALVSANIGFYNSDNKNGKDKISSISTSFTYSQYNQIILPLQADIWTKNNKYNIIVDWRYLEYPSTTFGLGGKSKINDGYTIDFNYIKFHQTVLLKTANNLYVGAGYYYDHFWNVEQVNPPSGRPTEFQKYGLIRTVTSSGIALRALYDSRLNQINPTNGFFGNIIYRPNFKFLGSDDTWSSLLLEFRKYVKVGHKQNVLAFWNYNWLTVGGKPPYLLLPSTGWDDFYNTGRGYIQGRYRGKHMIYLETEYRFGITHNGLIGGVFFINAESFPKQLGDFAQPSTIAPGIGTGIRIKLNKITGTNLCIDYGFGFQGSKGIAVNLAEVF